MSAQQSQSFFSKIATDLAEGFVSALVRAGAKFGESLMSDAEKTIEKQRKKIQATREGVNEWVNENIGHIDDNDEGNR